MMRSCVARWMVLIVSSSLMFTRAPVHADLIPFLLGANVDGSAVDGVASGSLTINGLTATFSANDGNLNATTSGFGINASGPGDDTDALDAGSGVSETITITFNQPVEFTQLSLSLFSGSETAQLTLGLNSLVTLSATAAGNDIYNFTSADFPLTNRLAVGQSLVIGAGSGNGFSLDGFQLNTVPEPSALAGLLPGLIACQFRRKRSIQSQ